MFLAESIVFYFPGYHTVEAGESVGKWRRYSLSIDNPSYMGNPFALSFNATFHHPASGTTIKLPGYYAGEKVWKVGFMPTQLGTWRFETSSPDPDLDKISGSLECVESNHPGMLKGALDYPRKWKFTDGEYVIPIGLLFSVFMEDGDISEFSKAADFLKNDVKGHLFNFRLGNPVFSGHWRGHRFNLQLWDRLEQRMEVLTERGLGVSIMLYTDDSGEPRWGSPTHTPKSCLSAISLPGLPRFRLFYITLGLI